MLQDVDEAQGSVSLLRTKLYLMFTDVDKYSTLANSLLLHNLHVIEAHGPAGLLKTIYVVQWLCGRVLDSRSRVCRLEPHRRHCIVSLNKKVYPRLSTGSTQEDPSCHE